MTARPLFIGGTSSNAGKSWMTTAICAWLRSKGVSVAPFKAQNMSNHSYPCAAGGEIGRAQVAQAEACGLDPEPAMNPILLKPSGNGMSQVIVHGRMWKTMSAREYYTHADALRVEVRAAYEQLARRFDVIVIEGAGSVSELNLRHHDVVNLDLVTRLRAPWLLVADIERGGVFASVYGTVDLLSEEERSLFRGFLINRFRGDRSLFDDGVRQLEQMTSSRCLGVFPYESGIHLDAEDSLAIAARPTTAAPPNGRTAIVRLPHLSNATDFRLIPWADWITEPPTDTFDTVILPGTKNTIDDLHWLRRNGLADWIVAHAHRGGRVAGICGGYQMLGRTVADPLGVESSGVVEGLALLPVTTTLAAEKTTRVVSAVTPDGAAFGAYEIHVGVTTVDAGSTGVPFATLSDGSADGLRVGHVYGTYLHGALEHGNVCAEVLGVDASTAGAKADDYRKLGEWFAEHVRHAEPLLAELGVGPQTVRA